MTQPTPQKEPREYTATDNIDLILEQRGDNYGDYESQSAISQALKHVMFDTPRWQQLTPPQRESLELIANKIGRILNGNPMYQDSWKDIAGYATLVSKLLAPLNK